ncbi:hypothetical protein ANN_04870 [Periplaneta americana]|uniref:Uncharacterized protein n=1 Tax=Periplaneta americana TaxID=6978 RepID=A0ABQ8T9M1_PERAM|nr:hypothetical protein ANN_04870 [Periplaneta americana]
MPVPPSATLHIPFHPSNLFIIDLPLVLVSRTVSHIYMNPHLNAIHLSRDRTRNLEHRRPALYRLRYPGRLKVGILGLKDCKNEEWPGECVSCTYTTADGSILLDDRFITGKMGVILSLHHMSRLTISEPLIFDKPPLLANEGYNSSSKAGNTGRSLVSFGPRVAGLSVVMRRCVLIIMTPARRFDVTGDKERTPNSHFTRRYVTTEEDQYKLNKQLGSPNSGFKHWTLRPCAVVDLFCNLLNCIQLQSEVKALMLLVGSDQMSAQVQCEKEMTAARISFQKRKAIWKWYCKFENISEIPGTDHTSAAVTLYTFTIEVCEKFARETGVSRSSIQRILRTAKCVYNSRLLYTMNEDNPDRRIEY